MSRTYLSVLIIALVLSGTGPLVAKAQSYTPPAGCIAWYDGCNWCSRMPDGGAACTKRACMPEATEQPYCTASANPDTPVQAPAAVEAATAVTEAAVDTAVQTAVNTAIEPAIAETQEVVGWVAWVRNVVKSVFSWW